MIVKTENLSREFVRGKNQFYAVDHVNLEVEEKELVTIMGQSGSGKSNLSPIPNGSCSGKPVLCGTSNLVLLGTIWIRYTSLCLSGCKITAKNAPL